MRLPDLSGYPTNQDFPERPKQIPKQRCVHLLAEPLYRSVQEYTEIRKWILYATFTSQEEKKMDNVQWKWEGLYQKAFLETDAVNLPTRINDAERAIAARTTELRTSADGEMEWRAIEDAISGLSILKREVKTPIGISAVARLPISNS
jgi:hypothetical protein